MGFFDFLKIVVSGKKPAKPVRASVAKSSNSCVEFDGKSFPIAALTTKGLIASSFDGSLIQGQNARVTVKVDDAAGKFSFATTITVTDTSGGKMIGAWTMLPTEVDGTIRKYNQLRKQAAGK